MAYSWFHNLLALYLTLLFPKSLLTEVRCKQEGANLRNFVNLALKLYLHSLTTL